MGRARHGCHEETVRRAYWRGLLKSQRFGAAPHHVEVQVF